MPTYEYACTECGHQFDIVQSFSDDALTTCEVCGGPLRKVFGSVGIVFKGSGFYKTDSRGSSPAKTPVATESSTSTESSSTSDASSTSTSTSGETSSTKSDAKAPAKPTPSPSSAD